MNARYDPDWTEVYADARIAFPSGVRIRTEDDERGGVKITAYVREFVPPLPDGMEPPEECVGSINSYVRPREGIDWLYQGDLMRHDFARDVRVYTPHIRYASYRVLDARASRQAARYAARRWSASFAG